LCLLTYLKNYAMLRRFSIFCNKKRAKAIKPWLLMFYLLSFT
jgi:hypothetical protein